MSKNLFMKFFALFTHSSLFSNLNTTKTNSLSISIDTTAIHIFWVSVTVRFNTIMSARECDTWYDTLTSLCKALLRFVNVKINNTNLHALLKVFIHNRRPNLDHDTTSTSHHPPRTSNFVFYYCDCCSHIICILLCSECQIIFGCQIDVTAPFVDEVEKSQRSL